MAGYVAPRRTTSTASTISVAAAGVAPVWMPDISDGIGKINTIYRQDQPGVAHDPMLINPDTYMADGTPQVYRGGLNSGGVFSHGPGEFYQMWFAQDGGLFAPTIGRWGSLMIWGGGHFSWNGSGVIGFDLETGKWTNYHYPPYMNHEKSIVGGTVATLTGHTVAPATSPVDSSSLNVRVANNGNYIKYLDDTPIPGAGAAQNHLGTGVTTWNPAPWHTNAGITFLPSDAGGGPLGSIVVQGHAQTGVGIPNLGYHLYRFDLATKVWSAVYVGDLYENVNSVTPGLAYDSTRKIVWIVVPNNIQPFAVDFKFTPPRRYLLTGNWISQQGHIICNWCYVPSRELMVFIVSAGDIAVTPGQNDASRKRYPRLGFWKLAGFVPGTNYAYSGEFYPPTSPNSGATYVNAMEAGTNTGWPGYRSTVSGPNGESELPGSEEGYTGSNGVRASDNCGIMCGTFGKVGQDTRGSNDILLYSPIDDCLMYLDPMPAPPYFGTARAQYLRLWKLRMPPVGQEATGTWTWESEICQAVPGSGGACTKHSKMLPTWGGRCAYVPSLKCLVYTSDHNVPTVGMVRSKTWV